MVKMINQMTGTETWVADERVEEYKALGHRIFADAPKPEKKAPEKTPAKKVSDKPVAKKGSKK